MDHADAKLFAELLVENGAQSVPGERMVNLAECYLEKLRTPFLCCGNKIEDQCPECPMKDWDKPNHWTNPIRLPEKPAPRPKHPIHPKRHMAGRKGVAIRVGHLRFSSMTAAAKEMGVHRAVINRMLRDGEAQRDEPSST